MRKLCKPLKAPSLSPPSHQVSTYLDKQQRPYEQLYLSFPHSRSQFDEARSRGNFSSYYEQVSEQTQISNPFQSNKWNLRSDSEKHKKQIEILNDQIVKLQKDLQIYKNQQVDKFDRDHQNLNAVMQGYQKKAKERKAIMKKLYAILRTKEQEIDELSQSFQCQIDDMNNKMIQFQEQCNCQLFQQEDKIQQLEQIINTLQNLKQSKLQELEIKEQKMKDILQKLLKKHESKEKIDEVQNILAFIVKEKQKYQLKSPDYSQQQNNISKEYQIIITQYESVMMQINRFNQLISEQFRPEYTSEDSIYQLSQNIKEMLKQNCSLFQEVKDQKEQQTKSIKKLEKYKKQIDQKNDQIESLKMDIKNAQIQNLETVNSLNERIKKQQQQIEILQQQNIELNKILVQNEQILADQQEKEHQLLQEIQIIQREKTKSLQQDENDSIKYKNKINDLHQQIDDLNAQLDNMYNESAQLQSQIDEQEIEHKKTQIQQKNTISKLQLEVKKYQQLIEDNKLHFNQQIKQQQQQHKQRQQELINNQNQIQKQLNEYLQIIENLKNKDNLNSILENLIENLNLIIKQKLLQNLKSSFTSGSSPIRGITKTQSPTRQILYHYHNQIDIQRIHTTLDNVSEQFQNKLNLLIKKDEKNQELIQHYCQQIEESQQTIQELCDDNDQQKQFITQMCKHLNIEKIEDLQERKSSSREDQLYIETLNINNTQIQHLISYNQQLQQEIQQQKLIIKDYEIQIDHQINQIKQLSQEKEDLSKHVSPTQSSRKESNIKVLQNEEIYCQDQLVQTHKDKISILNMEISNLEHQLDSQIKIVQSRNEEIQSLNTQVRDLLEKQQYFEQLINELNTHNLQLKNQEEIQIIRLEGVSYDISHNSLNFDTLRTPTNQHQIVDEIKQEQQCINFSLSEIAQMSPNSQIKQIMQLNKEQESYVIQEQEIKLAKQKDELNQLKSVIIKNESEISDLKSQLAQVQKKMESLIQEQNLMQKKKEDQIEKEPPFDEVEFYKKEIQGLNFRNEELQIQITQLKVELQQNGEQLQNSLIQNEKKTYEQNEEIQYLKTCISQKLIQISQQDFQIQNLQEKLGSLTLKQKKLILKINSTLKDIRNIYYEQSDYLKSKLLQEQQIFSQNCSQLETKLLERKQIYQTKAENDQIRFSQFVQQNEIFEVERKLLQQQNLEIQQEYEKLQNSSLEQAQFNDQLNDKLKSLKIQIEQKDRQLKQNEIQLQEMVDQKELANKYINTLQLEITQLKQTLNKLSQDNNMVCENNQKDLEEYSSILKEKEKHLKILQNQLQELQVQYELVTQNLHKTEQCLSEQNLDMQSVKILYESKLKESSQNLEMNKQEFQHKMDMMKKEIKNLKEKDQNNLMKLEQFELKEDLINKQQIILAGELLQIRNELQIKINEINQINSKDQLQNDLEEQNQDILKDYNNNMCEQEIIQLKQTLKKMGIEIVKVCEQQQDSVKQNQEKLEQFTKRIKSLESQLLNLEKEKLLSIESQEHFKTESQQYLQKIIMQEKLNNQMENEMLQQKAKIKQFEIELEKEYERSKQKQNSNAQQRDQLLEEKDKQISELIINSDKSTQQIKEAQKISNQLQIDNDKLKGILNTQLDQIAQLEKTIKKYQQQMVHANSEREILILSYQESEKKSGSLMKQNEKLQMQMQQQEELIKQQQQQLIIWKEDLKQKSNTITDLQNKLFETNKFSSQKTKNPQDLPLNQQQMIERQKNQEVALQFQQMKQLQDLYSNQILEISELKTNISEFQEKEILDQKINEDLKAQLQNALVEKEKLNNQVNSILNEKQSIEVKLKDVTQTRLQEIELYKQEIAKLNQGNQIIQQKLGNALVVKQQLGDNQNQKINQVNLNQSEISKIQKVGEEKQKLLLTQIKQEKQKQNSQIEETNKDQTEVQGYAIKNQKVNQKEKSQKYPSKSNLDKEVMIELWQVEQGAQMINFDENKSHISDNSDRKQLVSVLDAISDNESENLEKSGYNQNQSMGELQEKIVQLQEENDKIQRQLKIQDDFVQITPSQESELIRQLRQEIQNLKKDEEQGQEKKKELQQEIVKLRDQLTKKDEEIQNQRKECSNYIEMCEKAIIQDEDWVMDLNNLEEGYAQRWRIVCDKLAEYEKLQGEIIKNQNEIQELQQQIKNYENLSMRSIIVKQSQSFDDEDIFSIRSTVSKLRQELDQEKFENNKLKSCLKSYLNDEQRFEEQNQRVKEENKSLRNRINEQQEEIKQLNEKIQNCQDGALASHLISLLIKFFESLQKENKQEIQVYYQSLVSLCRIEYNELVINKLFQSAEKKSQGVFGIFRRDKTKEK
ncbi:unnamed protein product [Paramecium octaurelia]|uniref:Uncharacterized protein n=1 Tax=Paramecium octaurelia TaxID=43137 RepID=A0A8S1SRH5_PAROT|nr:unnamed protein product [Paramecium octaurelia]